MYAWALERIFSCEVSAELAGGEDKLRGQIARELKAMRMLKRFVEHQEGQEALQIERERRFG